MKKLISLIVVLVIILSFAAPAFAAGTDSPTPEEPPEVDPTEPGNSPQTGDNIFVCYLVGIAVTASAAVLFFTKAKKASGSAQ